MNMALVLTSMKKQELSALLKLKESLIGIGDFENVAS